MNFGLIDSKQVIQYMLMANTLGHSILIEVFNSAVTYYAYSSGFGTNGHYASPRRRVILEGSSCFAFIQGTGLDLLLERQCMDYNPERLRQGFQWCLKKSFPVLT